MSQGGGGEEKEMKHTLAFHAEGKKKSLTYLIQAGRKEPFTDFLKASPLTSPFKDFPLLDLLALQTRNGGSSNTICTNQNAFTIFVFSRERSFN